MRGAIVDRYARGLCCHREEDKFRRAVFFAEEIYFLCSVFVRHDKLMHRDFNLNPRRTCVKIVYNKILIDKYHMCVKKHFYINVKKSLSSLSDVKIRAIT